MVFIYLFWFNTCPSLNIAALVRNFDWRADIQGFYIL